jgi:anti-anti-sigma factor
LSPLSLERDCRYGPLVLRVCGEVDLSNQWVLADELLRLERDIEGPLVLDVENVDYIDASGLQVLLDAAKRAQRAGESLALRRPGPLLRRLLRMTGLDRTIVVLPLGDEPSS